MDRLRVDDACVVVGGPVVEKTPVRISSPESISCAAMARSVPAEASSSAVGPPGLPPAPVHTCAVTGSQPSPALRYVVMLPDDPSAFPSRRVAVSPAPTNS